MAVINRSNLTCPECGHSESLEMPDNQCVFFHKCAECKTLLRPKEGDCCVFCSYGDFACPPIQAGDDCCSPTSADDRFKPATIVARRLQQMRRRLDVSTYWGSSVRFPSMRLVKRWPKWRLVKSSRSSVTTPRLCTICPHCVSE